MSVKVEPLYKKPLNVPPTLAEPTMFEPSIPVTRVMSDPG